MKRTMTMAITALLMCSCSFEDMGDCPDTGKSDDNAVEVEFSVCSADSAAAKSSMIVLENAVRNLNLFIFYKGKLETSCYVESSAFFTLKLFRERSYNMYVLANMGKVTPPQIEEDMIGYKYSIETLSDIRTALPMAWSLDDYVISGSSSRVNVVLERLVSRINLCINSSELEDFRVTAVRIRQGTLEMFPFYENGNGGSKASSISEVGDGDWASQSDLSVLNAGQTACFYALENCQGVLLPGNKSAESKIPDEIPANAALCTFLELTASYTGEYEGVAVSSDNVLYRFYLGSDNCSDFNVRRNSEINIGLIVTKERIFDESWKASYGEELPVVSNGLELSRTEISMTAGEEAFLTAAYYRSVDGTRDTQTDVTSYAAWTSSDAEVATVSSGRIQATGAGTATITATYNGYRAICAVAVKAKPVVYSYELEVTPASASLYVGKTYGITATYVTYADGVRCGEEDVTSSSVWTTSDAGIASVYGGTVTGTGAGTAIITAKYNGLSASCTVTSKPVIIYVSGMSVSSEHISGNTYQLKLSLRFSDGTSVENVPYTWTVTSAQSPYIPVSTTGNGPLTYIGGGTTYVMAISITTTGYYNDGNGNRKKFTTGTSISHNTGWKP